MATATTPYNLPIIESTDKIAASTTGDNVREDINALATATNTGLVSVNPFKRTILSSENMDDIKEPGFYRVLSAATADALGLPFSGAAEVEVKPVGTAVVQELKALAPISENWQREMYANGTTWGGYRRTDFHTPPVLVPATTAGYKLTASSLSTGYGGGTTTGAGYNRYLMSLSPWAVRGRICAANVNPRFLGTHGAAVGLPAVTIGVHTANGAQTTVLTVDTGATTGAAGYRSPVIDLAPYAGKEILAGLDWSGAGTIQLGIGTSWGGTGTGAAGTGTATKNTNPPLFVWIEYEVPEWVPTYAVLGDSLSCAIGAANPIYDSPASVLARRTGGVPMHWAHSGDSLQFWPRSSPKWDLYGKNIAPADVLILAGGSNDVFGGAALADLQARFLAVVDVARQKISPNIYAATIAPRTSVTGAMETTRRQYNTWLKTGAAPVRAVYDFAAAISTDDENITPAVDADGTHYTAAGYAAQADLLTAVPPLPANPDTLQDSRLAALETAKVTIDNTVGRRALAWDAANNRAQMVYGDTGSRLVTSLLLNGTALNMSIRRVGNVVDVNLRQWSHTTATAGIFQFPDGFKPDQNPRIGFIGYSSNPYEIATFQISSATLSQLTAHTDAVWAQFSFTTSDAWPASLPGTAVGAPA